MLEEALEANTAAVKALVLAIRKAGGITAGAGETAKAATANKKQPAAKKQPSTGGTTAVSIKSVNDLVLSVADAAGRGVVVAILGKFDAKRVKEVPKAKYPSLIKLLKAALVKAKAAEAEVVDEDDDLLGDSDELDADTPDEDDFDDDAIFGDD